MRGRLPHSEPNVSIRFLHKNEDSEIFDPLFAQESMLRFCAYLKYSVTCFLASLKYIYIFKLESSLETHLCRYH